MNEFIKLKNHKNIFKIKKIVTKNTFHIYEITYVKKKTIESSKNIMII